VEKYIALDSIWLTALANQTVSRLVDLKTASFQGSLSSAFLVEKDPGCGWSCDHPESEWLTKLEQ